MSETLLEYWNLNERPFEPVTDSRFYYSGEEHAEALARLRYLVDQETMYLGMLTGEIGCGKSMIRQVFAGVLDRDRHFVLQIENAGFPFDDLLRRMLADCGWRDQAAPDASSFSLYESARSLFGQLSGDCNKHAVLLLDEAQEMGVEALGQLKRLTNLNDEGVARLSVVLIGQPELRQLVSRQPALDQRISLRFHLPPLESDHVDAYLRHRLLTAGHPTGDLFEHGACRALHAASRGVAREINRLAKLALETARSESGRAITRDHVEAIVSDLRRNQPMPLIPGVLP